MTQSSAQSESKQLQETWQSQGEHDRPKASWTTSEFWELINHHPIIYDNFGSTWPPCSQDTPIEGTFSAIALLGPSRTALEETLGPPVFRSSASWPKFTTMIGCLEKRWIDSTNLSLAKRKCKHQWKVKQIKYNMNIPHVNICHYHPLFFHILTIHMAANASKPQ